MKTMRKNNRREIRRTLGRYLAILSITALGVGLFSGLSVTKPCFLNTMDAYVREACFLDYRLLSTLGWEEESIAAFRETEDVTAAEGAYTVSFLTERERDNGTQSFVLTAHSLTDGINTPALTAGRMPETAGECLGDRFCFSEKDLGMTIPVSDPEEDSFGVDCFTLVGLCQSPLYMNMERGSASIGDGTVSGFILTSADSFALDVYTDAYITLTAPYAVFTDDYNDLTDKRTEIWETIAEEQALARYDRLYAEAAGEIADARDELNNGLAEYEDGRTELEDARATLGKKKEELADGWEKYRDGQQQWQEGMEQFEREYADAMQTLTDTKSELDRQAAILASSPIPLPNEEAMLQAGYAQYEAAKELAEKQFAEARAELDSAKAELDGTLAVLEEGEAALTDGETELAENEAKLADARAELDDGLAELADAEAELADFLPPDSYVLGRDMNAGFACFESDSSIVEGIAKVFPVFFFLVAALVCMTTMTRMVDEQRTQIGTLKAMGYSNGAIAWKYISYAGSASLIGGIFGNLLGCRLFPTAIWTAYKMLYHFADGLVFSFSPGMFGFSIVFSLLCSVGATVSACYRELVEVPAGLIRPKSPASGKRILLERIGFFWKKLPFLYKVSLRNIFRYKKRLFMMLLGIGGCTALVITGFGIRDSVNKICDYQYDEIMYYDVSLTLSDPAEAAFMESFVSDNSASVADAAFLHTENVDISTNRGLKSVTLTVAEDLHGIVDFHLGETSVMYPAAGECILNTNLAEMGGFSVGDTITFTRSNRQTISAVVTGLFENYIGNYIYIHADTYADQVGESAGYETVYVQVPENTDPYQAAADLMQLEECGGSSVILELRTRVDNMMQSMDFVVILVIACAAALAFIVLINLSNINITERMREIATIKVLGFYPGEVGAYVFRENLILTTLGAIAGIPLGVVFHRFVMSQIMIDLVSFNVRISPMSFVLSVAMTFLFTVLVDLLLRQKLARIHMAESLKSVE